ncbi:hypothetical protein [Sphingobacterium sp. BS-2]|uniref:hypothetical protein n=1 Tax=Sphingobacterium sp. BS-2 TaxID=3377129 RepID=UPI0038FC7AFE
MNQDGWDGRIDQELGMNQDRVRQANPQRMGGWTKNWGSTPSQRPSSGAEMPLTYWMDQDLEVASRL